MQEQTDRYQRRRKFITVTLNTAIDCFIRLDQLVVGQTLLAEKGQYFAAGKGVNVAKTLAALGYETHVLGFVGQQSLGLFNGLNSGLLKTDYCIVKGHTRINITLSDGQGHTETHIRTPGFSVTAEDCQLLMNQLVKDISPQDVVILSGSLPEGVGTDFYAGLIELCHKYSAIVFLDTNGSGLAQAIKAKPFLIKPNQQEFEALIGQKFTDERSIVEAARELIASGIEQVVVSRAEKGAIIVDRRHAFIGALEQQDFTCPISSVGCGDAMVAGLVIAKQQNYNLAESIRLGMACGSANLYTPEAGRISHRKMIQLNKKIGISTIK